MHNQGNGLHIVNSAPVLSHNIITSNSGSGIFGDLSGGLITWIPNLWGDDVWNNTIGDYGGDMTDRTGINGNISADPEFVDSLPPDGDYRLQVTSPCRPGSSPTAVVMGGFPEGTASGITDGGRSNPGPDQLAGLIPETVAVARNAPNPFTSSTAIRYQLPEAASVNLTIYNTRGELLRTLVDCRSEPGYYAVDWDGTDRTGGPVAPGVYFYRFTAGTFETTCKMMLLR